MRLELRDPYGYTYQITSSDPVTLGRWILETFMTMQLGPDDPPAQIHAWPSFDPQSRTAHDWLADTRVIGQLMPCKTPEEMLKALQDQIAELEAIRKETGR